MTDIGALQTRAKDIGFRLTQLKNGSYVGSHAGIEFEDDDPERLFDDMEAVVEMGNSDQYTLVDETGEDGESIVEVTINGETKRFEDPSPARALAQAKEAFQAAQPKPQAAPRGRRRSGAADESLGEAEEAQSAAEEILPPVGGGDSNVLKIDLRAFQAAVRELADAAAKLRTLIDEAVEPTAVEAEAEKPRRGRPRKNGR